MGVSLRGAGLVGRGPDSRAGHGEIREAAIRPVWIANSGRIQETVLGGNGLGNLRNHLIAATDARRRSLLFWRTSAARGSNPEVCRLLGSPVSGCGLVRRIHYTRIHAVHTGTRNGFLAGGAPAVNRIWCGAFRKPRRSVGGGPGRGLHWSVLVPDFAAHRNIVVRSRDARLMGLG